MAVKMERILCLHGKGVNSTVFASQTTAIRNALGTQFEMIYIDAPYPSPPYPGIERFFDAPFYSWYDETEESKEEAVNRIQDLARQHAATSIMGFSQGAAMAAVCVARDPSLFRWAVYMGGGWPLGDWTRVVEGEPARLRTPAVHVVGRFDVGRERGLQLYAAQQTPAHLFEFSGHHEVPKLPRDVASLARLINDVAASLKSVAIPTHLG